MSKYCIEFSVFLLLWCFLLPQFHYPVQDGDYYWHIRTGDYILKTQQIPENDLFSFTTPDKQSLDESAKMRVEFILTQYWLSQVIMSQLHSLFGESGVVYLRMLLFGLLLPLLYLYCRRFDRVFIFALVFIAGSLLTEFPSERPQLFSFVLMPLVLFLLEQGRKSRLRVPWELLVLPPVTMLWANLHGSFLLGLVFCLIYLGVHVSKGLYFRSGLKPIYLSFILLAVLASMVNPNGLNAIWVFLHADPHYIKSVYENLSPWEVLSYGHYYPAFWICFLLSVAVLLLRWRQMSLEQITVLIALMVLALSGLRYMAFLALGLPLLVSVEALPKKMTKLAALCAIFLVFSGENVDGWASGADPQSFPVRAVDFMQEEGLSGRVFSLYDWGGYIGYRLSETSVFIDGRGLIPEINEKYEGVVRAEGWQRTLDEYKVDYIIMPGVGWHNGRIYPLIKALTFDWRWELIQWDDVAVVFARSREVLKDSFIEKKYVHQHILSRIGWLLKRESAPKEPLLESKAFSQSMLGDLEGALETYSEILRLNKNSILAQEMRENLKKKIRPHQ